MTFLNDSIQLPLIFTQKTVKPTSEIEDITPEKALDYLTGNTHNRNLSIPRVNALVREILEGRWKFNGESIVFSPQGVLLDGQHRLHAIMKSGVTLPVTVVRDVPEDAMPTLGGARPRSAADVLHIDGYENATVTASACKRLMLFKRFITTGSVGAAGKGTMSNSQISDYIAQHPGICDAVKAVGSVNGAKGVSVTNAAVWHYIAQKTQRADAERDAATRCLTHGYASYEGDPVFLLRERVIRMSSAQKASFDTQMTILNTLIHAWNLRLQNKRLIVLKFKTEPTMPLRFDANDI